jgi:hypothetical protein
MDIAFRTKVSLTPKEVTQAGRYLESTGVIDHGASVKMSYKELSEILKQEMVYGALEYLSKEILNNDMAENGAETLFRLHKSVPKGYTRANGLD